jgi:hypothetical protein
MSGGDDLKNLSQAELIDRAERLGVPNPQALERDELLAAIAERRDAPASARGGWLGRARDLVARVVERGLHMPDAAAILRGAAPPTPMPPPPPLSTVTLAEIYAAQGHFTKAVKVLEEVLEREPEHSEARALRQRYVGEAGSPDTSEQAQAPDTSEEAHAPEAPPPVLEEPALADEASAVDDVVCLATDPTTAYVYWELRALTYARARWRDPQGRLILRVLCFSPHAPATLDIDIEPLVGDRFVRGLEPGGEVRICVAWLGPRGFVPLAVAAEMQMPRDYRALARSLPTRLIEIAATRREAAGATDLPAARGAPAERAAGERFRGYLGHTADVAAPRMAVVDVAWQGAEGATPSGLEPPVSRFVRVVRTHFGGASDLYSVAEVTEERAYPGPGPFGGASDLFGGASDLTRGRLVDGRRS